MSNRALCATSTASPAELEEAADARGDRRRAAKVGVPQSGQGGDAGWSGAPGFGSVWKRSASSSPRTRTAPISQGRAVARSQAGRLEVEDDVRRAARAADASPGRRGERDEVAAPAQPRVGPDRLVEQRPRQPGRNRAAQLQHLASRLVGRDRAAPILDQLDEPVCGIEAQLHDDRGYYEHMFVSTRPGRQSRGLRRGRKDGSEVSCGSDLTHLSPRDPRVPPSSLGRRAWTLVFRRSVLVERPARLTRGPTRGKDTVSGQRRRWPSVRGAGAPGDGTARPFLSPGAAVLVAA